MPYLMPGEYWVIGCFSLGLDASLMVCGSEKLSAVRNLMPSLSAKTRVYWWKFGSCKESWSPLQHSSPSVTPPTQFTRMVLKALFLCYWISSFPGREGTWSERWESWLNSRWGCLATDGFCCCVVFSAIQYGWTSWSCQGSESLPLSPKPHSPWHWSGALVFTDLACTFWVSLWQLCCF